MDIDIYRKRTNMDYCHRKDFIMKKTITGILVLAMLLSALSACSETPAETTAEGTGNTTEITDPAAER